MAAKDGTKALEDLLVKIEIDSDDWVKKSAREKLKMLVSEVRMNSEKLVGVAEDLVSSIASIVRANTSNPAVDAYLGLLETGFGLIKANTVMNNVFVSAKHEVHNQYDALASLIFTIGMLNYSRSTLRRLLKAGAPAKDCAAQFLKWKYYTDRATGEKKISQGLVNRRQAEYKQYLGTEA